MIGARCVKNEGSYLESHLEHPEAELVSVIRA